jgi:uroporphyrinogen decarboxylase
MTNRERVIATLKHKQPDKTPYDIGFTQPAFQKMVKFYGDPDFASKLGNCLTWLGCEPANSWREVKPDIWADQFGVQWNRSVDKDIGVVCNQLVTPDNVDEFPLPDPDDPSRYEPIKKFLAAGKGEHFVMVDHGFSLFERAWTLAGMENVLMAMAAEPDFANALLDRILEFNLRIIEHVCKLDVDAMMFGDDWGQQRGVIIAPPMWREFIGSRIKQMFGAVKARGKFVLLHSCGKVQELFPDLIEYGLDVFNPFQPEVMDPFEMKKQFGNKLSFYGGISTQRLLPYGTVEQVKTEVKRLLDMVGKNGGYIAAPAHATPADAKPENIAAMIEVLKGQ